MKIPHTLSISGSNFAGVYHFSCGNDVPVYEVHTVHALNQMIGHTVFENGYFVFQRGQYHTVYAIDRITEIKYSFNDGIQVVTPEEEFADSCCLVVLYAIGDLLLTNRENYNHRHWTTSLASDNNQFADESLNPENIMIEREERAEKLDALRKAMSMLTPKQQKVIKLYYFDKLTLNQIAKIQGITPQSVFDIIRRAQKAMKNFLENS